MSPIYPMIFISQFLIGLDNEGGTRKHFFARISKVSVFGRQSFNQIYIHFFHSGKRLLWNCLKVDLVSKLVYIHHICTKLQNDCLINRHTRGLRFLVSLGAASLCSGQ
nr:PREDICTED: uncharacterized protein LOC103563535 [Equus przewalskii]